jgi:hypothetical protein
MLEVDEFTTIPWLLASTKGKDFGQFTDRQAPAGAK